MVPYQVPITYNPAVVVYKGDNNRLGDCLTTAAVNIIARLYGPQRGANTIAVSLYDTLGGPANGGLSESTLFSFWGTNKILGTTLQGETSVSLNPSAVRWAIFHYKALLGAIEMPIGAGPYKGGWLPGSGPNFFSHAIVLVGYNPRGVEVETWGVTATISWKWFFSHTININILDLRR